MAKEWYLLQKPYGKYDDNDAVMDEAFNSNLGVDVEICNYDLSDRRPARVIMGSRTQDTELKTRVHYIICKIGTCVTGEYVYYDGRYWLVTGIVDNNGVYEKAVIEICEYYLTWQADDKTIVQRWASAGNATQYNNGETRDGKFMLFRSDQLRLTMPDDDAVLSIHHAQRFILDKRTLMYERQFGEELKDCTTLPVLTYKMTRIDSVSANYGDCGTVDIMVTQDAQLPDDGFYVIDGKGYWLAFEPEETPNEEKTQIECEIDTVYIGMGPTTFSAPWLSRWELYGDYEWYIDEDIKEHLVITESQYAIDIACNEGKMNRKEFTLALHYGRNLEETIRVSVKEFI